MTTVSKTVSSTKQYQLIDLNGELVNFKIDYILESTDDKPFDVSIVSQEHLDDNRPINYKKSENGKIIGTLENVNNVKENYYIAIKSKEEVEVNITINRTDIPAPTTEMDFELKEKKSGFIYKYGYIIFIVIMLIGFGIYYYMYIYKPDPSIPKPDVIEPKIDIDTKSLQADNVIPDIKVLTTPKIDKIPTPPPKIDTKSYTPVSSIHSVRSSEASSPASERSDISESCKNAINELMSKCIDL